ncbi:ran binding protein 7, partial [Reticulomyxa filosa]
MYMKNSPTPLDKQSLDGNKYQSNMLILRILQGVFRIFYFTLQMDFPMHLRNKDAYPQWLQLFVKFFEIPAPLDLALQESMLSFERLRNNNLCQMSTYNSYYTHPYEKCRKWAVRCVTRIMQLFVYGRPEYCFEQLKPIAKFFLEHFASKFMKIFYMNIIRAYTEKQFVYFKTLSPALKFVQLCTHYGNLFSMFIEQNQQPLDDLVFNRLFKLICYNPEDIALWNDNPHDFVNETLTFEDLICIRTDFVLDKTLKFCLDIVKKSIEAHERLQKRGQDGGQAITREKYYEIMAQRDGVFHMLGAVANPFEEIQESCCCCCCYYLYYPIHTYFFFFLQSYNASEIKQTLTGKLIPNLQQMLRFHVFKDFKSPIGFLRARACWMVGKFYRINWTREEYAKLTLQIIDALNDSEIPVKLEASHALGRLATTSAGLATIKDNMDKVLSKYMELIDELGFDNVIMLFDLLVDRLEQDFTPRAKTIMLKLLELFNNLQKKINEFVEKRLCKQGKNDKGEKLNEMKNETTTDIMMESEEREKEEEDAFDNHFASANQILRCINTVLFSAVNLPAFLAQLEELVKPLLIDFFERPKMYEMHASEIYDMIHTLSLYSDPLSKFLWQLYSKVIEYYLEANTEEFNQCVKILCNFINAVPKYKKDFTNLDNKDLMEELLVFAQA